MSTISARLRRPLAALGLGAVALAVADAAAQKPYAIPESPAFTFLDATPAQVSRPTTPRAFATALLNGISPAGQLQQGVAFDVAPWSFAPNLQIPLRDYQQNRAKYALANTQLSLATVRASGDTADTDLGVGVRVTLYDNSDPMADTAFTNELRRRLQKCRPADPSDAEAARADACFRQTPQDWRKEWLEQRGHWNEASLAAAFAGGWRFAESRLGDREWRGWAGWVTGALPLGRGGQAVAQLRFDERTGADDGLSYGGRAFYGSAAMNAFVEVAGGSRAATGRGADWTGGLEFRAMDNLWLSTGFGSRAVPGEEGRQGVLVADLRWNLAEGPRFNLGGQP